MEKEKKIEKKYKVKRYLWNISSLLRGNMDAYEYKNYILGFVFLKFISDKIENNFKKIDLFKQDFYSLTIEKKTKIKNIFLKRYGYFLEPKEFFSSFVKRYLKQEIIIFDLHFALKNIVKRTINTKSENSFKNLFNDINLKSNKLGNNSFERNKLIGKILLKINDFTPYKNSDFLSESYEYLISQFTMLSSKKAGEFYTPETLVNLITKLIPNVFDINQSIKIYDPACGSGSLLIKTFSRFKKYKNLHIYGQELNHTTFNLARMNMFLHNLKYDKFLLKQGNTLLNDRFKKEQFDVVVGNPPFSSLWEPTKELKFDPRFKGGLAPNSRSEFAFIQHMLYHLKKEGIMISVAPYGVLFRGGREKNIRKYLLEKENCLDAVIILPKNLFFNTTIPASLLIFKKNRKLNYPIFFINASKEFDQIKNQNFLKEKNINKICDIYTNKIEIEKYSRSVNLDLIRKNDYNLNINFYINTLEEEILPTYEELQKELFEIKEKKGVLLNLINKDLEELGLKKLF